VTLNSEIMRCQDFQPYAVNNSVLVFKVQTNLDPHPTHPPEQVKAWPTGVDKTGTRTKIGPSFKGKTWYTALLRIHVGKKRSMAGRKLQIPFGAFKQLLPTCVVLSFDSDVSSNAYLHHPRIVCRGNISYGPLKAQQL